MDIITIKKMKGWWDGKIFIKMKGQYSLCTLKLSICNKTVELLCSWLPLYVDFFILPKSHWNDFKEFKISSSIEKLEKATTVWSSKEFLGGIWYQTNDKQGVYNLKKKKKVQEKKLTNIRYIARNG